MFSKILRGLLVPKRTREKPKARAKPVSKSEAGREKLLKDVMAVYRQQRQDVYDSLDETTRRQIEEDAEKAFGEALRSKS